MNSDSDSIWEMIGAHLPGFEVREGQRAMLRDITQAYREEQTALIEAGTGTGKSLAYLIPALLWALEEGEPTVVATNTIALQEQLIEKDIPFVLRALDLEMKAVLVKGMHNYLCLRKLEDHAEELPESLQRWAKKNHDGSKSSLPVIPSPDVWELAGAEAESCTHVKCPHYKECFYFKARREAADAHLIVVNHHLFFADLALRRESDNFEEMCVLPPYRRLILDEAHHIEDVATEYFASKVSRRGIIHFLGRLVSDRSTGKLLTLRRKLREAQPEKEYPTLETILLADKSALVEAVNHTFNLIGEFLVLCQREEKLRLRQSHLDHPYWAETLQPAITDLVEEGRRFIQTVRSVEKQIDDPPLEAKCEGLLAEIRGICKRLEGFFEALHTFVFAPLEPMRVRWIEGESPNFHLIAADLEIGETLAENLFAKVPTTILCSATLATNRDFTFIKERLGIEEALQKIYESPFDYEGQALFSIPSDLPDPTHRDFVRHAAQRISEIVEITGGNTFVLFTSYAMLRQCEQLLSESFLSKRFPLLCQGDASRTRLLDHFRNTERAVLFGTDSFWEGVDVVGDALRCVILVKLPFKVPSDPLFQARSEAISQKGGSPFFDYSLPSAIVKFKQGFGRLIRNREDRGCVICLDSRLIHKGYGKQFLKSLPPCPNHIAPFAEVAEVLRKF